jgi:hypothetical protein
MIGKLGVRIERRGNLKYYFVNGTKKMRNELAAEVLGTFLCKPHNFRKTVKRVFVSKGNLSKGEGGGGVP